MTEMPTIKFPHPTLTPIKGKPNTESLQRLRKEVKTNAKAVYSTRGGGKNGHLYIVLSKTSYAKQTGQIYTVPNHPGEPADHPTNTNVLEIMELNRKYNTAVQEFQTYHRVKTALKQQLLDAIEPTYLAILDDPEDGFAEVEPLDILDHLQDAYGNITAKDLEDNRNKLLEPWDPNTPIEDLWTRIARITQFAKFGKNALQYTEVQHLTMQMFKEQGLFDDFIRDWNYRQDRNEKTWPDFQEHFTRAAKHHNESLTSSQAGYQGAAYKANDIATEVKKYLLISTLIPTTTSNSVTTTDIASLWTTTSKCPTVGPTECSSEPGTIAKPVKIGLPITKKQQQ